VFRTFIDTIKIVKIVEKVNNTVLHCENPDLSTYCSGWRTTDVAYICAWMLLSPCDENKTSGQKSGRIADLSPLSGCERIRPILTLI